MKPSKFVFFWKCAPLIAIMVFSAWFFGRKVLYFGKTYEVNFIPGEASGAVESFAPEENPLLQSKTASLMRQDWNTFRVRVPKTDFQTAEAEVNFQNPDQHEDIRFGILHKNKAYQEEPLQIFQPIFEALSRDFWEKQEQGDLILWQRKPLLYSSVGDFLDHLPDQERIMTYNYDLFANPLFSENQPLGASSASIESGLKGGYDAYTYLERDGDSLDVSLVLQDLNTAPHVLHDIMITVFGKDDTILYEETLEGEKDDIRVVDNPGEEREVHFTVQNLASGYYRIHLESALSIQTKRISVSSPWLVFGGSSLAFVPQETKLYLLSGDDFFLERENKIIVQDVMVGNEILSLTKPKPKYMVEYLSATLENPIPVFIPQGGVKIHSNGFVALDMNHAFVPFLQADQWEKRALNQDALMLSLYDFILMRKTDPEVRGRGYVSRVSFDLEDVDFSSGVVEFRINAPYLNKEEKELLIGEISITLERERVFSFQNYWDYQIIHWFKRWKKSIKSLWV